MIDENKFSTQFLTDLKNKIFNLSIRMLSDVQVAEDATQDILIKIINQINTLKDENKFTSWALAIAKNHLLNVVKRNNRFKYISFEVMEKDCNLPMEAFCVSDISDYEKNKLLAELKISCSQAMLMCLSSEERFIYILSLMFQLNSKDGGSIMGITPDNYRQKLHRIILKLKNFIEGNCGLVNKEAICKCNKRISYALLNKRISKENPEYVNEKYFSDEIDIKSFIEMMDKYEDFSDLFTKNPMYILPEVKEMPLLNKINEYFSQKAVTDN